ncbi:MAG: monomethylamine:corrinoid methyltransferase [Anaerolineales bacterium]|nr:monomethylamine:corrinoid methyltransferase [Anaerolineales bacterium]
MLSFDEIIDRAMNGPISSEKDFELKRFVRTLRQIVKKYDIRYDPATPAPWDDDLADRVWQAGLEFISQVGIYCTDTERIIEFSAAELEQALRDVPKPSLLGEGQDSRTIPYRAPESEIRPFFSLGAAGCPVESEEILMSLTHAYAEIPYSDAVPTPSLTKVDGRITTAGSPLEIEGCIRTARLGKEALRRAGRPGLCIPNFCPSGVLARGHITAHSMFAGPGDMMEIGGMAELKIDFDSLSKIAYMKARGCPILGETGPILGGYCGGPEGAAVTMAAYHLFSILVLRARVHHPFFVHFNLQTSTSRDVLWARAVSGQAISRNSTVPCLHCAVIAAGPSTGMSLYETAAWAATAISSGGSIEVGGAAHATHPDYLSPMEPLVAAEVGLAVSGMPRQEVNTLVLRLLEKYEDKLQDPPLGQTYQECYDIITRRPKTQALQFYHQARQEFANLGLLFKNEPYYS